MPKVKVMVKNNQTEVRVPVGNVKGDPILTNFHQQEFSRAASRLKKQVTGICR